MKKLKVKRMVYIRINDVPDTRMVILSMFLTGFFT